MYLLLFQVYRAVAFVVHSLGLSHNARNEDCSQNVCKLKSSRDCILMFKQNRMFQVAGKPMDQDGFCRIRRTSFETPICTMVKFSFELSLQLRASMPKPVIILVMMHVNPDLVQWSLEGVAICTRSDNDVSLWALKPRVISKFATTIVQDDNAFSLLVLF